MKKLIIGTLLIALALAFVSGCNESSRRARVIPIREQMMEPPARWIKDYGSSFDSQVAWNLAVIRHDQRKIAAKINEEHPIPDPNVPTIKDRLAEIDARLEELNEIDFYESEETNGNDKSNSETKKTGSS